MGATVETWKRLDPLAGGVPEPSGTIDRQTIWSNAPVSRLALSLTAGSPACPRGFAAVHVDINFGAGGKYAYLCVERATAETRGRFITDVRAVVGGSAAAPPACPDGFAAAGGDAKEGTAAAAAVRICYRTAGADEGAAARVATDVSVEQGRNGAAPRCPDGTEAVAGDLSAGVGEQTILCVRWEARTDEVAARGSYAASTRAPADAAFSTLLAADKSDVAGARLAGKGAEARRQKPDN